MHILLATEPVDFRKAVDGLAGYVRNILDKDPFNDYVFVFSNIKRTSIKLTSIQLALSIQIFPGILHHITSLMFHSCLLCIYNKGYIGVFYSGTLLYFCLLLKYLKT
ncbi:MAG: IS66 family insertion sequence element accessory protein TnpB [Candidatus Humimicrobiaceae bacterium]